jgi:RNA polymerase sigma-70 factor (ECF subfamily)
LVTTHSHPSQVAAPPGISAPAPGAMSPEQVFVDHFDFVWRSLRRLGVPEALLDDAAQEVFVVVCRRLADFAGRSALRSWLFGIAMNVARKALRTQKRRGAEGLPDVLRDSTSLSPQEALAQAEAVRLVYELLDELTQEKREVFILAELEEMPAPQIAEAIGVPVNTVYSRLRLARQNFSAALQHRQALEGRRRP